MAGTITALSAQRKRQDRVNVYLDGEYAFGVKDILAARLRIGQVLSDDDIAELGQQDRVEQAYSKALGFLSYRPRSTAEVRWNLQGKEIPDPVIETVIERLESAGLVSDAEFAQYWVDQREQFKPRSVGMLRHELRQKGVALQDIDQALQDLDEAESARRLAGQQASRYANLKHDEFQRKLAGYLQRRGFRFQIVKAVIEELWQELQDARPDS